MSKVRINDLARELEVKSRPILDALEAIGVTGKTHSSSIEADQAERVREYFKNGGKSSSAARQPVDNKPKFDLSKVSKPGDALKAILERKQAEAAAKAAPPRPTAVVAAPASVPAAAPRVANRSAIAQAIALPSSRISIQMRRFLNSGFSQSSEWHKDAVLMSNSCSLKLMQVDGRQGMPFRVQSKLVIEETQTPTGRS